MISNTSITAARTRSIVCASPMMPLMSAIISSLQYLLFCKWRQLLIPDKSMLISSCDEKHCQCSLHIMMRPMSAIRIVYMQMHVWRQLFISNIKFIAVRPRSIDCTSRAPVMPLMSAIIISMCNVIDNWKQLIPKNQYLAATRAVSMLSLYDASLECHHNFNVQCRAQLKTANTNTHNI